MTPREAMDDNRNVVATAAFSSPTSERMYRGNWPDDPVSRERYAAGRQCGGCSFFAAFDADWGLCAHAASRHRLETVFEHFTCPEHVNEGWGAAQLHRRPALPLPVRASPTGRAAATRRGVAAAAFTPKGWDSVARGTAPGHGTSEHAA